jgi:hypothetical protein
VPISLGKYILKISYPNRVSILTKKKLMQYGFGAVAREALPSPDNENLLM